MNLCEIQGSLFLLISDETYLYFTHILSSKAIWNWVACSMEFSWQILIRFFMRVKQGMKWCGNRNQIMPSSSPQKMISKKKQITWFLPPGGSTPKEFLYACISASKIYTTSHKIISISVENHYLMVFTLGIISNWKGFVAAAEKNT